jgi:hypothetical protein
MATTHIVFGPDLEPLESESRRGARTLGARRDSLIVSGTSAEVVAKLVEAVASTSGWCELEQARPDDRRTPVYVNAHAVRWVGDDDGDPA